MIFEFVASLMLALTFFYFSLKLWNKHQLKKLRKKYPEGTETKSVKVTRFDEIPTGTGVKIDKENTKDIVDKLK